jgi:tetratricopeptide (TPR) repeat protein
VTRRGAAVAGLGAVFVGVGLAGIVLRARDERYPAPPPAERLLYLRSGGVADRLFLSFDAVAADVYWIRAIQHYGRDRTSSRPDRFQLLNPLLDLTTTLDPYFNIAYRFGAIFLSMEPPNGPDRTDQAIALLEKGLRQNPDRWQYAHDIGFIHYWYTGDYRQAAGWFEKAAAMPGAPGWIQPLAAVTLVQGGDRAGARQLLGGLATSSEKYIRAAAERGLMQLTAMDALDELQAMIDRYHEAHDVFPSGWGDLPELRGREPVDPTLQPFVYDQATHRAELSPRSSLAPLPKVLAR